MIGIALSVIGLATVVAAAATGDDGGSMSGIAGVIGGGTGLSGMGLVAWHMVKGEPARRAEFEAFANTQEERAVAERESMRAAHAVELARMHEQVERLMDRAEKREAGLAAEVGKLGRLVAAKLQRGDTTALHKAITDEDEKKHKKKRKRDEEDEE